MAVETERLLQEIDTQADQLVSELADDQLDAGLVDEEEYEPEEEEYEDQEDASDPTADLSLSRSDYLSPEHEAIALRPGHDGLPDLRLAPLSERMVLVTSAGELINPRSRALYKVGIYSFVVRGTSYYRGAKTGDFRPGAEVTLVREPDNQHDPHAIAVYAANSRERAGYVKNCSTCSSSSLAITETWDLDRPVMPRVCTSLSIRRVLTPSR